MEQFKKDLFFQKYGRQLEYRSISDNKMSSINAFIEAELGSKFDPKSFFTLITEYLKNTKTVESLESPNDIKRVLDDLNLLDQESILVIWNYPNEIDIFGLSYLIRYWENIWFGVSDDAIGLFFPKTSKMVLVTHWNVIYY